MLSEMKKSAIDKIVELISIRDHSEKELRTKLTNKKFSQEEIDIAVEQAEEIGLLAEPLKLSANVCDQLNRKSKGILYINQYLKSKGLPSVLPDWEMEFKKASELISKRINKNPPYTIDEKQDIYRYLSNRGYADQTINKVINEKF